MKRLVGLMAALVLIYGAVFHVGRESQEVLGLSPVLVLLAFGFVMWTLLNMLSNQLVEKSGRSINSALWLHSILEGALTALSFSFSLSAGLVMTAVMALHLLPEGLATIAALKQAGFDTAYAVRSYLISVLLLGASLLVFTFLPSPSELLLVNLTTIVAGGFIFIAISTARKALQS